MAKTSAGAVIRLRGVRQNNLKHFDLDLPTGRLIVVTGLSGSGKSSLAFDTLFAEGQRRYIETFSPYARQFFDRMDKPAVDSIEGIPPAIAIAQRNTVRTTRSTVGTMTEICDYLKLLWPQVARLHCHQCGELVRKEAPQQIWKTVSASALGQEALITFTLPLAEKLSLEDSLALISKQGYQRLLHAGRTIRLEEAATHLAGQKPGVLTVIQDRLRLSAGNRARLVEACEQAYHFGKGKLTVHILASAGAAADMVETARGWSFSRHLHCAACDIEYRDPSPALFSFNHPLGACPACKGFGRLITVDYNLAIPDRTKTLAGGVIKPWQSGMSAECQEDLMDFCRKRGAPVNVPFCDLEPHWQDWVISGDPGYGKDRDHEWPNAWYGVKGYFRWLESKTYKMHVRVLLSRYRVYTTCPECRGARLKPEALWYRLPMIMPGNGRDNGLVAKGTEAGLTLSDFYRLPLRDALQVMEQLIARHPLEKRDPLQLVLEEVRARIGYLVDVGLGYLTLDRPTRTLSGGETERVNLTTCLGTRLVNTLFVLDEPSVGLHPRDTGRLVRLLERLRDTGNTVVVVEHEASVMRAADQIVDLGPGHGESGGEVVFQGTYAAILKSNRSLTGQYLAGKKQIPVPTRRPVDAATPHLSIQRATCHNLRDLAVDIPLSRFVVITGVSGSGKTTLVREVLLPRLLDMLRPEDAGAVASPAPGGEESQEDTQEGGEAAGLARISGGEHLGRAVLVDQSPLGRTPRSNPAVYIGAFDDLRELFAQTDAARQRGMGASAFSFNSEQGQCARCRGAGFEKIEMQFLSDVFIRCPDCQGRRYRPHVLDVKIPAPGGKTWSIGDLLEATVDETVVFLSGFAESKPARRALTALEYLREVGLGYLRLGQPINTLSGGESQRLKLVSYLAEFARAETRAAKPTLFLFDEPTTGLHFEDVRVLLQVFQKLVDGGHSLVVIEHHLEVMKSADWLIDLGPEAGDEGGRLVACGTPETVMGCAASHTGQALREMMND
ncbi:MAG: excinuclease ABC subunit UvrA [Verrucomicrobiota bacterium]